MSDRLIFSKVSTDVIKRQKCSVSKRLHQVGPIRWRQRLRDKDRYTERKRALSRKA